MSPDHGPCRPYRLSPEFEGIHSGASWQDSTIGGKVSQIGLPANPIEEELNQADSTYSPHETSGLVVRWTTSGDRLEFTMGPNPGDHIDNSTFEALSFRVTQKDDPTSTVNPVNADQDFYVLLRDASAHERMAKASKPATIPYPYVRGPGWNGNVIKLK